MHKCIDVYLFPINCGHNPPMLASMLACKHGRIDANHCKGMNGPLCLQNVSMDILMQTIAKKWVCIVTHSHKVALVWQHKHRCMDASMDGLIQIITKEPSDTHTYNTQSCYGFKTPRKMHGCKHGWINAHNRKEMRGCIYTYMIFPWFQNAQTGACMHALMQSWMD